MSVPKLFSPGPVFGALTSFIFLGEVLGIRGITGGILIVSAMLISELQWTKKQITTS
jgi:drug/metabolite transporter (DMT)-like permease